MRWVLFFVILVASNTAYSQVSLDEIRANYSKAVSDKEVCRHMLTSLSDSNNSAIRMAYLGGFQAIWANHVANPFSKLKTFKKGKANIQEAIAKDNTNAEIRFVRLSIQKNTPAILGYKGNIEEDTVYLKNHLSAIHSNVVMENILKIIN